MKIETEIPIKESSIEEDFFCEMNINPRIILTPDEQKILMEMMQQTWIYFVTKFILPKKQDKEEEEKK